MVCKGVIVYNYFTMFDRNKLFPTLHGQSEIKLQEQSAQKIAHISAIKFDTDVRKYVSFLVITKSPKV